MAPARPKTKAALKAGRPPTAGSTKVTLSQKSTSTTIRAFHQLSKALAAATSAGDEGLADELRQRIAGLGGLEQYQKASIQGQANDRGGDSSIVLVDWLRALQPSTSGRRLRLLEVGALSTANACSRSALFSSIERIDLHSPAPGIKQQDFMFRPLPDGEGDKFDVISLSLVLNFVPSPAGRGEMLQRTRKFLSIHADQGDEVIPCLFLVLPAACVTNSRYCNDELLTLVMTSLGYVLRRRKQTAKLVYYLWILRDAPEPGQTFAKREVKPGKGRNNFCIVLDHQRRG